MKEAYQEWKSKDPEAAQRAYEERKFGLLLAMHASPLAHVAPSLHFHVTTGPKIKLLHGSFGSFEATHSNPPAPAFHK